jgi:malonyl-CoA/methylmalonyl-CoA synthetase
MQVWRAAARELVKDNVAIVRSDDDRRVTYRELKEAAVAYAADWAGAFGFDVGGSLEERGRGKAVGVMAHPGAEYCAAMLAVWRLGWIAVPLSPSHPIGELTHAIREARVEIVFVTDNLLDKVADLGRSCPVRAVRYIDDVPRDRDDASRDDLTKSPEPEPDDGALVIFTSGTTGAPKAALHTHASLAAQIDSLAEAWGWTGADKILHALPLNHVHGIVNAWMCAHAVGAEVTFCAKFSATEWWRSVADRDDGTHATTTIFMGVPTMYVRLIQSYDAVESEERRRQMSAGASRLRLCVSGSAACPVPVAKRWSEIAGGKELLERYGATEIGMALSQPLAGRRVPGRVGHPLPGVQVKLVDGELRVKGPGVFGGYVGRPEATAACFDELGFFITGDATEYDENLGYRIMGRTSVDIIKHGGYKLSALEIESAVLEHPGVGECAVCGVPDDVYGEIVGCVLAPGPASDGAPVSPPPDAEELRAFLKDRMASYKAPGVVVVVDAVPRNAMGKVNKRSLVGLFGARRGSSK